MMPRLSCFPPKCKSLAELLSLRYVNHFRCRYVFTHCFDNVIKAHVKKFLVRIHKVDSLIFKPLM